MLSVRYLKNWHEKSIWQTLICPPLPNTYLTILTLLNDILRDWTHKKQEPHALVNTKKKKAVTIYIRSPWSVKCSCFPLSRSGKTELDVLLLLMGSKRNPDACCSDMLMTFRDDAIIAPLVPFCQPLRLKQHPGVYSNSILFLFSVFPFHHLDFFQAKYGASKANILQCACKCMFLTCKHAFICYSINK